VHVLVNVNEPISSSYIALDISEGSFGYVHAYEHVHVGDLAVLRGFRIEGNYLITLEHPFRRSCFHSLDGVLER
jgi:hypothetical protein